MKRLSALGITPEIQTGWVCNDEGVCGSPVNIIAKLEGGADDKDAVLLAAHYDSVPAGPGASDDGAGVATVLEIARILAAMPAPRHPVVLLLTDGEEAGLLGALLFVREHPLASQVKAAVNLEARGTSGPSLMFETGTANTWLMKLYRTAIPRPITNSIYYVAYQQLPNDTDFTVFKAASYQGFNFAFIGNVGRYHTPLDSWSNAALSSIQHQGDNALATVLALARSDELRAPAADAMFFDVFTRALIVWPANFAAPAALSLLILLLAEIAALMRKGCISARQLAWGGAGTLATLISGPLLCAGSVALLRTFGHVPPSGSAPWISQPLPMNIAAAAMAFLAAGAVGALLARRAGFWGFWAAATLQGAMLAAAAAALVPGISFVLLLPAAAAVLAVVPSVIGFARTRPPAPWAADLAALCPALALFAATLPSLKVLYAALGTLAWPVATLVLCLGTCALLPLFAAASRHARRVAIALPALAAAIGTAATLNLPVYTAEWPQRINFDYWLDLDTHQSHWLAQPDSLQLPAQIAAAVRFDPVPRPRFAGSESLAFFADAPLLSLAGPELEQVASRPQGAATHYDLHLRSLRGAPEALVIFPAAAGVREIAMATQTGVRRAKLYKTRNGATILGIVGLPPAGAEFSIDAAGHEPLAVQIFDQSYELPGGEFLLRARPLDATSSQDGDLTVVHRTVSLSPAAGR